LANAGGFYITYYLSTDNVITTSDTVLGVRYVSSLAAGASNAANTALTLPTNLMGTYYIGAIVDMYYTSAYGSSNLVRESDETNNVSEAQAISVAAADLTMSAISVPSNGYAGQAVTVGNTVTAAAAGGNAGGFYITYYLSTDNVITTSDTVLGVRYVSSLAAGASNAANTVLTLPTNLMGTYYIGAIADMYYTSAYGSSNLVRESDETNNVTAGDAILITLP
jgi:hypothetical protein